MKEKGNLKLQAEVEFEIIKKADLEKEGADSEPKQDNVQGRSKS